jgi:poly(3-hydroxybutyrate) depolymerase
MKRLLCILHLYACALGAPGPSYAFAEARLPALGADLARSSVSGISSGGFMAAQIATVYSNRFIGAGIIAAGPFYCAGSTGTTEYLTNATSFCMTPVSAAVGPSGQEAYRLAERFAADGRIDPVASLKRQRIYIFSGANDKTVKTRVVNETAAFYRAAGLASNQVLYDRNPDAGHSIVTANPDDLPCDAEEPPYINNCGFYQSHVLLRHIYPGATAAPATAAPGGRLVRFDQSEFLRGTRTSMDPVAWVYIPAACEQGKCAVHVAFHGCQQGRTKLGDRFYSGTGYNEFADTNQLIVLYPQAHAASLPPNPRGCWDFWGYSDPNTFFTHDAPQMRAVMGMLDRLGQARAN